MYCLRPARCLQQVNSNALCSVVTACTYRHVRELPHHLTQLSLKDPLRAWPVLQNGQCSKAMCKQDHTTHGMPIYSCSPFCELVHKRAHCWHSFPLIAPGLLPIYGVEGTSTLRLKRLHHQRGLHPSQKRQSVPPAQQARSAARLRCPSAPRALAVVHHCAHVSEATPLWS